MEPTAELVKQLYAEKIRQARAMSFEDKFLAGPRLFDLTCEFSRAGIRMQFPDADEAEVARQLSERIALTRRLESHRA